MSTWQSRGVYAPVQSWDPDFSFLTQVSHVQQARYDKGFNQVKSVYNSILNSPLTNEGNKAYRDEMFKRLDETLKKNASLDFSKAENVAHVVGLLDPLTKDKDLAYDMAVTKFHQNEKGKMESYRTSDDPEKRKLYSDYAKGAIGLAETGLANAVRGDGSIQRVQPQEFVPFEDINEYLNKAAKDQGLVIQTSTTDPSGYIIVDKNGRQAVPIFSSWAMQQMGNRFDRQLQLQSKVMSETQIRTKMEQQGIGRDDAIIQLSEELTPAVTDSNTTNVKDLTTNLEKIQSEVDILEKYYKNGIPASNPALKKRYDHLVEQQEIHKKLISAGTTTLKRINDDGIEYLRGNFINEQYRDLKEKTALGWGATRAMATAERELKADQVQITKWNNAIKMQIHRENKMQEAAKMQQDMLKHREDLNFQYWKEGQGGGSMGKSKKSGQTTGTGAQTLLGEDQLIDYLGLNTTGSKFKSDILNSRMRNNYQKMFKAVTQADNGLMQLVLPDAQVNQGIAVMNKVRKMSEGMNVKLTKEDKSFLEKFGNKIGVPLNTDYLTNKDQARKTLEGVSAGTYQAAEEALKRYSVTGTLPDKVKDLKGFQDTYAALNDVMQDKDAINRSITNIAKVILNDQSGAYENAKIVGYQAGSNIPIYDISAVGDEAKAQIDNVISQEFQGLTVPVGNRYGISGLTGGQIDALFNENLSTMYNEDGEVVKQADVFGNIMKFADNSLAELFSDRIEVDYDPVKEVVKIRASVDPTSGVAKSQKIPSGMYAFEIPYASVMANAAALPQIAQGLKSNTASDVGPGMMTPFLTDPYASVSSTGPEDAAGWSYNIQGADFSDGYGLNINTRYWDYATHQFVEHTQKLPIANPGDPTSMVKVNDIMAQEFMRWMYAQGNLRKQEKEEEEKIPLK